ncbi:MAG: hypothetical protein QOG53_3149 [Frankiales bacterium]|jgi:hypothetical protein|nr:hypothetical protein [Frankiales bacterium]
MNVDLIIGAGLGLLTSVVAWVITQAFVSPRVDWSQGISKIQSPNSAAGFIYRIKVQNVGWLRSINDLRLYGSVLAKGLDPGRPQTWTRIRFPLSVEDVASLPPGGTRLAAIRLEAMTPQMQRRLRDYGYDEIADNEARTLEQLFALQEKSYLVFGLLGSDGWTGVRHYRESPRYGPDDIRRAYFTLKLDGYSRVVARLRRQLLALQRRTRLIRHRRALRRHATLRFSRDLMEHPAVTRKPGLEHGSVQRNEDDE